MSTRFRRRKCCNCHQLYDPDPRSRYHQKHCAGPECRKASKATSQRRWRESDKGRDYFGGSANAHRVKAWRAAHPGYARGRRGQPPKPSCALQEDYQLQSTVLPEVKLTLGDSALQEMIITQNLVLTGLIVQLTGDALQDDIGPTIHRLIRLGQQVQSPSAPLADGQGPSYYADATICRLMPLRQAPLDGARSGQGGPPLDAQALGRARRELIDNRLIAYQPPLYQVLALGPPPPPAETMEHFLDCHVNAFNFFGGTSAKTMVDNLKSAVLQHSLGQPALLNPRYKDLADHYGTEIVACGVGQPQEKD